MRTISLFLACVASVAAQVEHGGSPFALEASFKAKASLSSLPKISRENAEPNVCGSVWLDLDRFEWIWVDLSSFNEILSDFVDLGQRIWLDLSGSVWI